MLDVVVVVVVDRYVNVLSLPRPYFDEEGSCLRSITHTPF
jgi:hypothetical protein